MAYSRDTLDLSKEKNVSCLQNYLKSEDVLTCNCRKEGLIN